MILFFLFSAINIIADTPDSLIIKYTLEYEKFLISGRISYKLKEGNFYPIEEGVAELPSIRRSILTPVGCEIELKYKVLESQKEKGIPRVLSYFGEEIEKTPPPYILPPVAIEENTPSPFGNSTLIINPFSFDGEKIEERKLILIKIYFRGGKWIKPRGYQARKLSIFLNKQKGEAIIPSIYKIREEPSLYLKLKTLKEGLYEVTPKDLEKVGINPLRVDPKKIQILGGYKKVMKWNLDSLLAMDTLPEVLPTIYEIDEDETFEPWERIIFYAHSLSGWKRNRFTSKVFFYYHPYTDTNIYWLRFNKEALKMNQVSQVGGEESSFFIDTIHLEEDVFSPLKSGLTWGWKELNVIGENLESENSKLITTFIPQDPLDSKAIIFVAFYPKENKNTDLEISLNGETSLKTVPCFGDPKTDRTIFIDTLENLHSGINELSVSLRSSERSIILDYIEIIYKRKTIGKEDFLIIKQDSSLRNYRVEGFLRNPYVLDISKESSPKLISSDFENGTVNFSSASSRVLLQSSPFSIEEISISNPTSLFQGGADWIVITPETFFSEALKLKNWRESNLRGFSSPIAKVVKIEEIYDNFSYGVKDPSAIKRFLYWTQLNWNPPPNYVLLFGNGSYDDKNLTGNGKTSFIPIHTEGITVSQKEGYLTSNPSWDSWFVNFNEDPRQVPDIPIGRVTASNLQEAKGWVDKLIEYEKSSGNWRMKAILLADDAFSATSSAERENTDGMESIARKLPGWIYKDKIYLIEYPREAGLKPSARKAHIESMKEGALVGMYIGHGNLRGLAHEGVFLIQDINLLSNWRKTPIYYFGSCDVGYFERPDERSIGDYSVLYKEGGTIVTIAAGRATGNPDNTYLGERIIEYLFNDSVKTAGEAFLFAKEKGGHSTYTFFGDPGTSILIDSAPLTVSLNDTFKTGSSIEIKGECKNSAEKISCLLTEGSYDTLIDGSEGSGTLMIKVRKEGRILFRGSAPIVNDSFVIKMNLPYDIKADSGRIRFYSRGEKESYFSSRIYFKEGLPSLDTLPPSISFQLEGRVLKKGDLIPPSGEMTLIISDSSGIDLRDKTNIQVNVGGTSKLLLGDKFTYLTGTCTIGEVSFAYEAPSLSDSIKIKVYAKDNSGNIGSCETSFKVGRKEILWNVNNYPNPMKDKTIIVYNTSQEVPVEIKIFTIAGRLVKEIYPGVSKYGINYVEWDGKDKLGRPVSNGVYYYMIKAGNTEPYYGKIAVVR
ncbi:MAG: C25 family cysteine peptidase [candidate division WOR-3 bacterium]